ncbi:MAG: hypothetical protein KGZ81_16330 [Flavobacteriales bacterium]|nr:hypothetical protein [Flavobacteriales bacterium]MBS4042157.1 hypothetical protein [Flavobacteriales bacterium]
MGCKAADFNASAPAVLIQSGQLFSNLGNQAPARGSTAPRCSKQDVGLSTTIRLGLAPESHSQILKNASFND